MVDTTRLSGITKASGKKTGQNSSTSNAKMAEKKDPKKNISKGQSGASIKVAESKPVKKYGDDNRSSLKPIRKYGDENRSSLKPKGQSSADANLRMAESKPVRKYGDDNRSSLKPTTPKIIPGGGKKGTGETGGSYTTTTPKIIPGGGKKGTGKTGGSYTSGSSTIPTTKPTTSTTKPVVKPITTTAAPAPKATPSVPGKNTGSGGASTTPSGSSSSTGTPIKIATSNLFVLNEPEQEIEQMANLIIQDIGGVELLSYSRNDLIAEQEINYQPIKNIADTSLQYSPLNILAVQDVDLDYFNKFPISLERHLPRFGKGTNGEYIYINSNNEIVVEAVNLLPGEYIEIQFLSFGSTVSDTIYT